MRKTPVRRAQLVSPFGVGAMLVSPDGVSMMPAGLDHWFEREEGGGSSTNTDIGEFRIEEWRLQRHLGVSHFRLPPDFRQPWGYTADAFNVGLTVPCLRFPQWHFCSNPTCRALTKLPLSVSGRKRCAECEAKKQRGWLAQVPFVAVCEGGHIQDFPWREWVHRSANPSCRGTLRLQSTGGASLAAQEVQCSCKRTRRLSGITEASRDSTTLTRTLTEEKDDDFLCPGVKPWHGTDEEHGCGRPLKGSLRSASNVYFSVVRSAIYLPRESQAAPADLISVFEAPHLSVFAHALDDSGQVPSAANLRAIAGAELADYTDTQIEQAVRIYLGKEPPDTPSDDDGAPSDDRETKFRRAEFSVLRTAQGRDQLEIRTEPLDRYGAWMSEYFDRVMLIDKLRETRALVGFERVNPQANADFTTLKSLLRRAGPGEPPEDWLPAYLVFGEGIFLELSPAKLAAWEGAPGVATRAATLRDNYVQQLANRGKSAEGDADRINARFLLVHTLAHVLMNRLTFDSGYSSAALRERLYVSDDPIAPMAAVLIYTAAGDAEGTMGGLVRMGKPERLGSAIRRAVDEARWCSSDPVCMEIGDHGGQGPDSCNLAACHNCALVPETACEHFNRFLDRGALVGTIDHPSLGYFSE